jgi:hypothetical protein
MDSFSAADSLVHTPTTGYEVGATEARLGLLIEARTKLLDVVRLPIAAGEPAQFAEARAKAARLSDELADRIPSLRIHVRGLPASAVTELVVDGSLIPPEAISAPVRVNPGRHELRLRAAGQVVRMEVDVAEHQVRDVDFPIAPAPPSVRMPLRAPARTTPPTLAYASFGVSGAALVLGATGALIALSEKSTLDNECGITLCPSSAGSTVHAADTWADVATVSFIVAGAAAVAGVVLVATHPHASSRSQAAVAWIHAASGRFEF